jgi:muramoyltetrapeptide carboxypeptidase
LVKMPSDKLDLLKPRSMGTGSGVSIIAPASFALPDRVDRGMENLRAAGFDPKPAGHALQRGPIYFAGTAEERMIDFHAAFAEENTRAVMCLRGGYGSNYLLGGLDLDTIAKHPKPFFAYSDLTGIQCRLLDQLGLPAFHGPMLAADFFLADGVHLNSFHAAICGKPYSLGTEEGLRTLQPGKARGVLYGGCLSILASLLGTPWEPHTEGKMLFLEDVGTKPYQVDRLLWQLRSAGKLDGVRGIIFGEMLHCASEGATPELLELAILNALQGFEGPIAFGLRSGHVSRQNITLTFGVEAELSAAEKAELQILEPAVTNAAT